MLIENKIFKIADSADKVICPPELVFKSSNFNFLFTIGGHLVGNEDQYQTLLKLFKEIGENQFTIKENLGTTIREDSPGFEAIFSVNSKSSDIDDKMKEFDEHFGIFPYHWFVYGEKEN